MEKIDHKANAIMFLMQKIEGELLNNVVLGDQFGVNHTHVFSIKTLNMFNQIIEIHNTGLSDGATLYHSDISCFTEFKSTEATIKRSYYEPTYRYSIYYTYDDRYDHNITLYYNYTVKEEL